MADTGQSKGLALGGATDRAMRTWWIWAAAVGLIATSVTALVSTSTRTPNETESGHATIQVASVPPAANVAVDGRATGYTPGAVPLSPGEHRVTVRHDRYGEPAYQLSLVASQVATIEAELWLQTPQVQRLRPAFRSARIGSADFLLNAQRPIRPHNYAAAQRPNASCGRWTATAVLHAEQGRVRHCGTGHSKPSMSLNLYWQST